MAKKPHFSRLTSAHTMSHNTRMPLVSATALPIFESTRLLLEATEIVEAPEATVHAPPPESKTISRVELHVLTILDWKWQLVNAVQSLVFLACKLDSTGTHGPMRKLPRFTHHACLHVASNHVSPNQSPCNTSFMPTRIIHLSWFHLFLGGLHVNTTLYTPPSFEPRVIDAFWSRQNRLEIK